MQLPLDTVLDQKLQRWSGYLTAALVSIPFFVLLGWQFDIRFLKTFFLPPVSMNPLTATCFILLGVSLRLFSVGTSKKAAYTLVVLVILAGILKFTDLVLGFNMQVDSFLYTDKLLKGNSNSIPNRMAPVTAACFILAGISLLSMQYEKVKYKFSHNVVLAIALMGLLSLLGYLYQVKSFYSFLIHISMAPSTALCFFLFSLIVLFSHPAEGIMKEFTSVLSGSIMARLLIPAAIIVPSVLGFLRLQGSWSGIYSNEFGTAIYVLSIIIIFAALTWYNAYLLNKRDMLRKQTEEALRNSEQHVQAIFHNAPDAVVVMDSEGIVSRWNPAAEKLFG